jgi:hypothetical protein
MAGAARQRLGAATLLALLAAAGVSQVNCSALEAPPPTISPPNASVASAAGFITRKWVPGPPPPPGSAPPRQLHAAACGRGHGRPALPRRAGLAAACTPACTPQQHYQQGHKALRSPACLGQGPAPGRMEAHAGAGADSCCRHRRASPPLPPTLLPPARRGHQLMQGDAPFYFVGGNAYWCVGPPAAARVLVLRRTPLWVARRAALAAWLVPC